MTEFKLSNKARDLTGEVFGSLTAIKPLHKKGKNVVWEFKCSCGDLYISEGCWVTAQRRNATNPKAPSCGCLNKETTSTLRYKHGMSDHPLFWVWVAMLERCYNPNSCSYHKYGAKGVTVCQEWRADSCTFLKWALENGWKKGLHLDKDILCHKLNIPKTYSPNTCQFISASDNSRCTSKYLINNQ